MLSLAPVLLPALALSAAANPITLTKRQEPFELVEKHPWNAGAVNEFRIHSSCNASEAFQLRQGLNEAVELAQHAKDHVNRWAHESSIYTKYFGTSAPTTDVLGAFDIVVNGNKARSIFRCDDPDGVCAATSKLIVFSGCREAFFTNMILKLGEATIVARTRLRRRSSARPRSSNAVLSPLSAPKVTMSARLLVLSSGPRTSCTVCTIFRRSDRASSTTTRKVGTALLKQQPTTARTQPSIPTVCSTLLWKPTHTTLSCQAKAALVHLARRRALLLRRRRLPPQSPPPHWHPRQPVPLTLQPQSPPCLLRRLRPLMLPPQMCMLATTSTPMPPITT